MAPAPPVARRVSYVIPPPSGPRTKLVLPTLDTPRRGRTIPLVIPDTTSLSQDVKSSSSSRRRPTGARPQSPTKRHPTSAKSSSTPQPTHRLGVSALAVDLSTHIAGKSSPEGILYSAGRDGLVIAWELGAPTKPRKRAKARGESYNTSMRHRDRKGDWKAMTGWDEDQDLSDEESDGGSDQGSVFDFDDTGGSEPLLPSLSSNSGTRTPQHVLDKSLPYEQRWQVDCDRVDALEPRSSFRQSIQSHNDWINDILLCNLNQNVISASNDGTVKMWSPHHPTLSNSPGYLGKHKDYVRCLAHSPKQNWVASGSFDRTIKLWDVSRPTSSSTSLPLPITTLSLGENSQKSSIYALATDSTGNMIASGSPERVVRLWDPRAGRKVGKLVGHTDNIRSILLSEDGRYAISASSDASIKVWSISGQRCLHTFAHHTESVWSLFSSHPSLSVFYSGDRSGLVCKVDTENCGDMSEGECVVLCRDTPDSAEGAIRSRGKEGINALVALDDWAVWTATGASDVKRWRDPGARAIRMMNEQSPQWDQFAPSFNKLETFGFSHLSSTANPSRSPTPVGTATASMLRTDSRHSKTDSAQFLPARSESPRPTLSSPLISPTYSNSSSFHRPNTHRQSYSGSVAFVDEPSEVPPPGSDQTLFGIPFNSLVILASPNSSYGLVMTARDPEVATLYSAASVLSVPAHSRPVPQSPPPPQPNSTSPLSAAVLRTSSYPLHQTPGHQQNASISSLRHAPPAGPDLIPSAQTNYESREIAIDATPLRSDPDEVLQGSHGLVRSVILNDRVHALTVDTAGEVALWDLMRGTCRGYFASADVEKASSNHGGSSNGSGSGGGKSEWSPRESLETVRELIEGEAMIASWANVETKMGSLTVHLAESTCFDAEVYADEAGFEDISGFPEEHRLNVGRWILVNLFSGFIQATSAAGISALAIQSVNPYVPSKGIHRGPAPQHINLGDNKMRRLRSNSELTVMGQKTPGAAVATPNMAPAVLPDMPTSPQQTIKPGRVPLTLSLKDALPTIPASPASLPHNTVGSPTPRGLGPNLAVTPGTAAYGKPINSFDYFSPRSPRPEDDAVATGGDQTPGGQGLLNPKTPGLDAAAELATPGPITPGGRLFGRFRGLGTQKKPKLAVEDVTSPIPATEEPEIVEESPTVRAAKINFEFLDSIKGQALQLPSALEAPRLSLPLGTTVMISEQASGENGWTVIYDGLVSTSKEDTPVIEATAPLWVLECLFANKISQQNLVKLSFMVTPWNKGDDEPLPELLNSQARLNASRALRVRKVVIYVVEKLAILAETNQSIKLPPGIVDPIASNGEPASQPSTSPPKSEQMRSLPSSPAVNDTHRAAADGFEIICNDVLLPNNMTLAAVRHYVWRQGGELMMQYRRKALAPSATSL